MKNKKNQNRGQRTVKRLLALIVALIFLAPLLADAQPSDEESKLQRWQQMSPEERQRIIEKYQRWKSLPKEDQERLHKNYQKYMTNIKIMAPGNFLINSYTIGARMEKAAA